MVTAHSGPLGRLGRALSAAGLTSVRPDGRRVPSTLLGGVIESTHDFPLDASKTTLLALGILHQCCLAAGSALHDAHWKAYVDLLPREVDSLIEWSANELDALQGSRPWIAPRADRAGGSRVRRGVPAAERRGPDALDVR